MNVEELMTPTGILDEIPYVEEAQSENHQAPLWIVGGSGITMWPRSGEWWDKEDVISEIYRPAGAESTKQFIVSARLSFELTARRVRINQKRSYRVAFHISMRSLSGTLFLISSIVQRFLIMITSVAGIRREQRQRCRTIPLSGVPVYRSLYSLPSGGLVQAHQHEGRVDWMSIQRFLDRLNYSTAILYSPLSTILNK